MITQQLVSTLSIGLVMLISFVVMRAAYGFHVRLHGYSYAESMSNGNDAAFVRFAGIFLGSTLAFWGVIAPTELGPLHDVVKTVKSLIFVIAFMVIAGYVNEWLILSRIDNLKAIFKEGNMSVAIIESGSYISTGLIFSASQASDGSFINNTMWFFGGQILLIVAVFVYAVLRNGTYGVDEMHESVYRDNVGYAFSLTGFVVSAGIVLHVVIVNVEKPVMAGASLFVWIIVTFMLQYFMNRFTIRGQNLKEIISVDVGKSPSVGAGILQGFMFLVSALVITILN